MIVKEAFDNFMLYKSASGLSENSLDAYRWQCLPLLRYFENWELESIRQEDIYRFLQSVQSASYSQSTKSSYIRSARIFLKWCSCEYEVNYRYDKIKVPKMPKKEIKMYSREDILLIFDTVQGTPEWVRLRNIALVALFLDSGIRRAEACYLRREDVDFAEHRIIVTGKGNKQRYAPFGDFTAECLNAYLAECPYESELFFAGIHGGVWSLNAVSQMFHDLQNRLPFKLSPHKCRHNFATNHCLDNYEDEKPVDPLLLQALMGHEDIKTTRRYLHQANELIAVKKHISHLDKVKAG
ncbi:MAG: tyrosine-type recombinase/integrase [Lachnospiraceae bacterium]|nr:tyrosine-type recombinase/integrase [Lachnospiraceae bacterium]